ncbi:MAG: PRC-barrel domain-containing protein [Arthrospira sp. SH-MAG29]|nr:PRC-barrel domain-containing protein [Arthrospira sp. SH-MAG29]MBS0017575.1 PRC-barrel domain-containing protein [Arthrospira sp. SH-MAG29]
MNAKKGIIKRSDLIGRLVLDRQTVEKLGDIEEIAVDLNSNQVIGFTTKSGMLGGTKREFSWQQIDTIGVDAVLVNKSTDEDEFLLPDNADSSMGHEVWTDAGKKVGVLVDYLIKNDTGTVTNYLFKTDGGLRGILQGVYIMPASAMTSAGSKRVIVSESMVENPPQYTEGLDQKISQARDFLQEDFERTLSDLEGLKKLGKSSPDSSDQTSEKEDAKLSDTADDEHPENKD